MNPFNIFNRKSIASVGEPQYDGIQSRGRRRSPKIKTAHEDYALRQADRQKLTATTQDLQRNFTAAAWAIRRHLDYVASFRFICTTGNDKLDDGIELLIREASKKENFDVSGRFRLRKFVRTMESRRCVDGDIATMKLQDGRLQAIEGDHIRQIADVPRGVDYREFINGVKADETGRIKQFMICDRDRKGGPYVFRGVVPADHMFFHAQLERFDQTRGISPIAAALNLFRDQYEAIDYAMAKMKLDQLFGLVITSDDDDGIGVTNTYAATDAADDAETDDDELEEDKYEVDFGQGLYKLELNTGDDAKILTSQNPSMQFQQFMQTMIAMALKSLDIPYSFFDESFTNFYGSRGGLMQYLKSCNAKREDIIEFLTDWTRWRLSLYIMDGRLELPAGTTLDDVMLGCQWVPDGVAWWDPSKEADGAGKSIAMGINTFEKVVRETGGGTGDIFKNIDDNARVVQYAIDKGFPLILPGTSAFNPVSPDLTDEADRQEIKPKEANGTD